uniref:GPI inositol-deacylase n=1 Tax=Mastacembelus armatus TaxID=205130 RepID=A0A3Q3LXM0_9TELE
MKVAAVAFYAFALGLLGVGVLELLTGFEENRCSMTYMFEYPEYRRVALPRRLARLYPAYGLYLYGEGLYAQETRALKLTGAPVLFLPGNAGSYKQARSLGSVALRKAESREGGLHFNVFTVDFNEELVALYGGSLLRQTHFLHESIKAILRLYKHLKTPPQSVVLVGHSMGGVVARALFTLPRFNTSLVNLIITQASPHLAPVLALDPYLLDFYSTVRQKWVNQANKLRNITVLSVGGGYRDYQVRSGLIALPCPSADHNKLSLVATAVPRTWVSTDHLSIVWCKELVLATVRAFFDLIDPETRQFTENPEKKMAVLNHHFIRHPVRMPGETQDTSISSLVVVSVVLCLQEGQAKYFLFALSSRRKAYSHFYCRSDNLVSLASLWRQKSQTLGFAGLTASDVTVNSSGLLHTIELQHFHQVYQAFRITVGSQCKVHKDRLPSVYRISVPWFREDSLTTVSVPSVTEISGMLHTSRPDNNSGVLLQLHTAPNCQYKVSIRISFPRMLGQILRFCGPIVPVYTAVTLLLAWGGQLSSILKSRRAVDMSQVVSKGLQPHKVNLPVYILHILLSYSGFQEVWSILCLPPMDNLPSTLPDGTFHSVVPAKEWPHLLSPLLYILGAAVAYWGSTLLCFIIRLFSLILAPQTHKEAENGRMDAKPLDQSKECNGTPLLSECALQEVRDDLQFHLCLSSLFTLPVMLSAPSLIHWIRNLRYSIKMASVEYVNGKPLACLYPLILFLFSLYFSPSKGSRCLNILTLFLCAQCRTFVFRAEVHILIFSDTSGSTHKGHARERPFFSSKSVTSLMKLFKHLVVLIRAEVDKQIYAKKS